MFRYKTSYKIFYETHTCRSNASKKRTTKSGDISQQTIPGQIYNHLDS